MKNMISMRVRGCAVAFAGMRRCMAAVAFAALLPQLAMAQNPPPVQTFYLPIPEDDLLQALKSIENGTTWIAAAQKPQDPVQTYVSITAYSAGTRIYYDQWENDFDADPSNPINLYHSATNLGGTQIWGDGNPTNGAPPGIPGDVIAAGTIIRLTNAVVSTTRGSVVDFDGGDKIAASKAIAVTRAVWASGSATLLAGANEVFDTAFFGTNYLAPVGVNIPDSADFQAFEYTGLSIMAGADGTTVRIDVNADGTFERTNFLNEGQATLVDGGVYVGARVETDKPVQVDLLTGDVYDGYESRFYRLLAPQFWSSSSTTPVSTSNQYLAVDGSTQTGTATTVWLYNPATNSIAVQYVTRTGTGGTNLTATSLTVPANSYLKQVVAPSYAARFINTNGLPFYALAAIDSTGSDLSGIGDAGDNRTWDWGFTLVPEGSLTPQVLVGLGIGRDPTSAVNPSENGSPVWVTLIGNGNTNVTVYVDYDSDPTTGALIDPNGARYDVAHSIRELDQLKVYNPAGDQTRMLIYVLDEGVKLAAAWGSDPQTTTPGQPGLDMGTGIPPLPLFLAQKRSVLTTDNDGDGYISPGDVLEYSIVIENTGRLPVSDIDLEDLPPSSVFYVTNTTIFVNASLATNSIPDNAVPPAATTFPLDEGGIAFTNDTLPVAGRWEIRYELQILDYTNLPSGTIDIQNQASVGAINITTTNVVTTPIYGKIGDFVWLDVDGDGIQDAGEPGLNGVTVNLLYTDGTPVFDANNVPISAVTATNALGQPGYYQLLGVPGGEFIVEFVLPSGYSFTTLNADGQGVAGAVNSDANASTGQTVAFTQLGGQNNQNIDAGLLQADLAVTKTVEPAAVNEGGTATFTIVVSNLGPTATSGVQLSDPVPAGLTYAGHSASQGSYVSGTGLWTVGTLTVGASATLTLQATANAGTMDSAITNVAQVVAADAHDPVSGNNQASAEVLVSGLAIRKTSSQGGTVFPGGNITYTIVVSNSGSSVQTNIDVQDVVPAGATYVSGSVSAVVVRAATIPTSITYSANGTFTVPAGTTQALVEVWGGGGGGASRTSNGGGGGGGGGAYSRSPLAVIPGSNYAVVVGTGGGANTAGGSSSFSLGASNLVLAVGGTGGTQNNANGAAGGLATNGIGAVRYNGGNGANGVAGSYGGGGGSSAGTNAVGNNANNATGATAPAGGGNGGNGRSGTQGDGSVGSVPGGGGGGALRTVTSTRNGGAGANGRVVVTYWVPIFGTVGAPPNLASDWVLEPGGTLTITYTVTVNDPAQVGSVCNTAGATSALTPVPITATVCNPIDPSALAVLGDRVWFDANGNGIQEAGETNPIANLPVLLVDTNGNVIQTTSTSSTGYYLFSGVPPGTYQVRFDLTDISTNVGVVVAKAGGNDALDSDVTSGDTGGLAHTDPFTILTGGTTNLNLDLGLARRGSTRAEVAEVWGEWTDGEGRVAWRTSSEWNTAGFFVYRVDPESGAETRLNDVLLPASFNEAGAIYVQADPQAREKSAGTYRLEEMEFSGATLDLGTHAATFGAPPPAAKAARTAARKAKAVVKTGPARTRLAGPSSVLKVLLQKEGIYGVGLQAIADGMGRSLEDVEALAATNGLRIAAQGKTVPTLLDAARGQLVFHGEPTDNWYTREAAYLISAGAGLPMARRAPGATGGESIFPVQLRFEEDRYPFDSAAVLPEDFYYWDFVISGDDTLGQRSFPLDLTGHAGGEVMLKVRLIGWSSTAADPDHLAEFRFNGTPVGSLTFDDQDGAEAELAVSGGVVSNGVNTLEVIGVLQPGHTHSFFVVDRIDAAFARGLVPLAATAHFRAGGAESVSAAAFAEPLALALDENGAPTWIADEAGALPAKAWAAASADERFAAVEAGAIPLLVPEPAAADAWFLAATNRLDYLVVASRELAPAAQELAGYRAAQGLQVGVATFEDVCDLLAGGLRTPEAVPALLAYAQATWAEAPWMVLLAGNGHYDYLGTLDAEVNHVPPMLLQTHDGIFAADGLLADLDGDAKPEVGIGRLPARTPAELAAMIAKIKAYEAEFGSAWQNQLVLAADVGGAEGDFSGVNAGLAVLAAGPYSVAGRIDLDAQAVGPARANLLNWFQAGAGFLHYTGHGGVNNWSALGLLRNADVNALTNARQPVVVALSCLVGRFESPGVDSLGEMLMRRAQGGAAAVWGPSGLSRNAPAAELGTEFYRAILRQGCGRLGLAVLQARRSLQSDVFTRDTLSIYNLLGDPALRIAGNGGPQALSLSVRCDPAQGGTGTGGGLFAAGARVQISAPAKPGWNFTGWSDGLTQNPRFVTVTHDGATYTARFQRQNAAVSVEALPNDGGTVAGGGVWTVGDGVQLVASANPGWRFDGWSDGYLDNPRRIAVPIGGTNCVALFARTSTLLVQGSPAVGGTVAGGGAHAAGETVRISATANPGWRFDRWNDGVADNPRDVVVPAEGTAYVAYFEPSTGRWPDGDQVVMDRRPSFYWTATPGATWYQLWIQRNGAVVATPWVEGATTWLPPQDFLSGQYRWWVRAWGPGFGYGAWSPEARFTIPAGILGRLTQIAPIGPQTELSLTYRWLKNAEASWYQLWVGRTGVGTWHDRWFEMSGSGEGGGNPGSAGPGPAKPVLVAPQGAIGQTQPAFWWSDQACDWWVRGWSPDGYGPWSGPTAFSVPYSAGTWYRVYANRGSAKVIDQWIQTAGWSPASALAAGAHAWWLGVWDPQTGRTIWSDRMDFTVPTADASAGIQSQVE